MESNKASERLAKNEALLKKLKGIILENIQNEEFGVTDLAAEIGLSRSQLHRKIKSAQNKSVSQFIRDIRLDEAVGLLVNDVGTASEIAYQVGFGSPAYFSKCFHERFGFPPGEARHRLSGQQQVSPGDIPVVMTPDEKYFWAWNWLMKRSAWRIWINGIVFIILIAMLFTYLFSPGKQIRAIAVLPLDNVSEKQNLELISNGVNEALVSELGQINALRVVSNTSKFQKAGSNLSVKEIAKQLDVDAVLKGIVTGTDDSVIVQLELIKAFPFERKIWDRRYEQDLSHVLSMQQNVVRDLTRDNNITITNDHAARLDVTKTVNPDIYKAYLRGMYFLNKSTPEDFDKGIQYLQEAVEYDPADPLAYTGLAFGYAKLGHGPEPEMTYWRRGKAAAEQALKLDSTLAEAHAALAIIKFYFEWDWAGAEREFKRSIQINPNIAYCRFHFAWYLACMNRFEAAIEQHKLAKEIDPLTPIYTADMGSLYLWAGYADKALIEERQALELDPEFSHAWWVLGNIYLRKGMYDKAIEAHQKASEINPIWKWALACTYAYSGNRAKALEIMNDLKSNPISSRIAFGIAFINLALGDRDEFFSWLERKPPDTWMVGIGVWPEFRMLHDDPRFKILIKKMNLPPV